MKLVRDAWTPLTVTIETHEEAEILHKILALVTDDTDERDANLILHPLFLALGKGLDPESAYAVIGEVLIKDSPKY